MTEDRIDFSPLDPTRDPARFEGIVLRIMEQAAAALAARRRRPSAVELIAAWRWPAFAAAAAIVLLAVTVLTQVPASAQAARGSSGLNEALGIPVQVAEWVGTNQVPAPADVLTLFAESR